MMRATLLVLLREERRKGYRTSSLSWQNGNVTIASQISDRGMTDVLIVNACRGPSGTYPIAVRTTRTARMESA
jgi:hypothetical protein